MRAAIFNHPIQDFYSSVKRVNSGILNYLSDIILPHNSVFFDVIKSKKTIIPFPEKLIYLNKYLKDDQTEYSFFKKYYKFGSEDNFDHKEFQKFNPELIIITSFAFCYFDSFNDMVNYLKKRFDLPIICGGAGPSSNPEYYLVNSNVDYVVKGPAEISLKNLVDELENNKTPDIINVYNKKNYNPGIDLNRKYSFKPMISKSKKNHLTLQITRGCPKKCSYCSIQYTSGHNYLMSSIADIIEGLKKLNVNNDAIHINFEDDNISFDKEYLFNVIYAVKDFYKDASFSAENGIDLMTLDENVIQKLNDLGFKKWNVSITSTNDFILKETKRNYTIKKFDLLLSRLNMLGSFTIVYFISGLPGDKKKNILNTIFYLAEKYVLIGISNFYPVPGTFEADKIKKEIIPVLSKGTSFYSWSKYKTKTLIAFFMLSRFINAVKNIKISDWKKINTNFKLKKRLKFEIKNHTRRELTMIGILYSIYKKNIYYVYKNDNNYELKKYNLNIKIVKLFFKKIYSGLKILNKEKEIIDIKFWRKMCKKVFL